MVLANCPIDLDPTGLRSGVYHELSQGNTRKGTMWFRNVVFVGAIGLAAVAFAASLLPRRERPEALRRVNPARYHDEQFQATLREVNASFAEQWRALGVQPAPKAPELTVYRRLALALAGTIPSLEEIRLLERRGADGLAWWTAGLLRDRRTSDYLAERLARATVGVMDGPFLIYRRRRFTTWLADELHHNRPYDRLVRQIISSDGLWTTEPAVNFITATQKPDSDEGPNPKILAGRVYRAFLGVRIDCAECHDHPFAPWKQADFHRLAAFFGKTENSFTGVRESAESEKEYTWEHHETLDTHRGDPAVPFYPELLPQQGNRRQRLAAWVTHPQNKAFARATVNRVWALLFDRPLVEPVDNIPLDGPLPPALDILADDFVAHDFNLQRLIALIVSTDVFQLDSTEPESLTEEELDRALEAWAIFPMTRLRPEQVVGGLLQACSVQTIDYESNVVVRAARAISQAEFVERYGDAGEDELEPRGGTIPQRLLMLNGELVKKRTEESFIANAATQIAALAPNDRAAVEGAFLAVLTRRPTADESAHFVRRLHGTQGAQRSRVLEDLYATLINSTEFSWNH
jgi:hypothetical protein